MQVNNKSNTHSPYRNVEQNTLSLPFLKKICNEQSVISDHGPKTPVMTATVCGLCCKACNEALSAVPNCLSISHSKNIPPS